MFWFLVSVVLLVVWLTERSSLKKRNTENYNRGWWEGFGTVGAGSLVLVTTAIAVILRASMCVEKVPALLVIGHTVLCGGLHALWSWLDFSGTCPRAVSVVLA